MIGPPTGPTSKKTEGMIRENVKGRITEWMIGKVRNSGSKAFKGVNTIFNKHIHKIIFEIQSKPFFKLPNRWVATQAIEALISVVPLTRTTDIEQKLVRC